MALLQIRKLTHYFGGLRAVYDFNLTLQGGELLGLIGPNGAGKTTIFNLVCGFYQPSSGEILFRGKNISGLRPHTVTALGIARTFQNIRMWNTLTVFENLCISQHHRLGYDLKDVLMRNRRFRRRETKVRQRAEELMEIFGLRHFAAELPINLPYGLQRRVEIARALAVGPTILLLDEPAAGMNPGEIDELIELIRWIRDEFKLTIWLIEHHMRVVMSVCEQVKVMDFGETIAEGPPENIQNNPRVIQAYLGDEDLSHA